MRTFESVKHERMDQILGDLVSIPSVSGDHVANREVINYVIDFLRPYPIKVTQLLDDGYDVLYASTRDTKEPDVLLLAHADVVEAKPEQFAMTTANNVIYGRGVWDMKYAIAAYLEVIAALGDGAADHNIALAITTDEETRNKNALFLLEQGYKPKCVLLPDGSNNWDIESNAKGAWTVEIDMNGKTAHGSRPWDGESAIDKLLDYLKEVREDFANQGHDTDTLNISRLTGGKAQNQVADHASAYLDIRYTSKQSLQAIQQRITEGLLPYGGKFTELTHFSSLEHNLDNAYMHLFSGAVEAVTDRKPEPTVSLGASEAGHFSDRGIPCIVTRPNGGGHHSDNEWIDRKAFHQFAPILLEFLEQTKQV